MEQKRLNLYTVNMKYIRDLHNQGDDRVFSVSPQVGNMIPAREDVLMEVDLKIHPKDSQEMKWYKNLMIDQLGFCRQIERF